jgi:predicted SnoaL-like aldol condensation-catalyzing enzyme
MNARAAKSRVGAYFDELLNARDLSACGRLLAPDYVDHDAAPGTPPGPAAIEAFVAGFLADYPDLRVSIEDILAEGDRVALRMTWRGTHRQSGEPLRQMGLLILRLNEAGQLAERWSAYRPLD